jgi:hypothetical protein
VVLPVVSTVQVRAMRVPGEGGGWRFGGLLPGTKVQTKANEDRTRKATKEHRYSFVELSFLKKIIIFYWGNTPPVPGQGSLRLAPSPFVWYQQNHCCQEVVETLTHESSKTLFVGFRFTFRVYHHFESLRCLYLYYKI